MIPSGRYREISIRDWIDSAWNRLACPAEFVLFAFHESPLRSDRIFLPVLVILLFAALAVTGGKIPDRPPLMTLSPRPTPTPTVTPTPGWWQEVAFATPPLPPLPGLPNVQLGGADRGDAGAGPIAFTSVSCPDANARIGTITGDGVWWHVAGTATVEPFWYWKMELSPDDHNWTVLYRSESPVSSGELMAFNTTTVAPGRYRMRLVVVKRDGNYPQPCTIVIEV